MTADSKRTKQEFAVPDHNDLSLYATANSSAIGVEGDRKKRIC
jgi:hypothetical protein